MTPADDDQIEGPEDELRPEPEFRPIGQPARKRGRGLWVALVLVVVAGGAGAGGWVYLNGWPFGGSDSEVPLIRAETGPIKVQPANPGGMEVPDQDKLVYDRMEGNGADRETVERLLPAPETPLPKPMPLPAPLTQSETAPAAAPQAPAAPSTSAPAASAPQTATAAAAPEPPPPTPGNQPLAPEKTPTVKEVLGAMRPPPPPAEAPPPVPVKPQVSMMPPASSPSAAQGGYKVQLAAVRNRDDVDKEWSRLRRQQSDLLGNLELSVMRADLGPGKGVFFRLRAGPLADEAAAKALCAKLSERKVGCLVVRPEG